MKKKIITLILALIVMFTCIIADYTLWDNGTCPECGGHWELFDIERSIYSFNKYVYKCDTCFRTIETTTPVHN